MAIVKSWDNDFNLPDFKRGATRTQADPDVRTNLFEGAYQEQRITTDVPVYWDVSITCDKIEAIRFMTFIDEHASTNPRWFTKEISTEFGRNEYKVRIISGTPVGRQIRNGKFVYNFTVECRSFFDYVRKLKPSRIIEGKPLSSPLSSGWYLASSYENYLGEGTSNNQGAGRMVAPTSDVDNPTIYYLERYNKEKFSSNDNGDTFQFDREVFTPGPASPEPTAQWMAIATSPEGTAAAWSAGVYETKKENGDPGDNDTLGIILEKGIGTPQHEFIGLKGAMEAAAFNAKGDYTYLGSSVVAIMLGPNGTKVVVVTTRAIFVSGDGGQTFSYQPGYHIDNGNIVKEYDVENPTTPLVPQSYAMSPSGTFILLGLSQGYNAISRGGGALFELLPRSLGVDPADFNQPFSSSTTTHFAFAGSGNGVVYAVNDIGVVLISRNNGQDWRITNYDDLNLVLNDGNAPIRAALGSELDVSFDGSTIVGMFRGTGTGNNRSNKLAAFASIDYGQTYDIISDLSDANPLFNTEDIETSNPQRRAVVRRKGGWIVSTGVQTWLYDDVPSP